MLKWIFALGETHFTMADEDALLIAMVFDLVTLHRTHLSAEDVLLLRCLTIE